MPIVPAVSIGAQETQLFLTRGHELAKRLGLKRIRLEILPLSIGFPFGLTTFFPANMPLPAKIVYQVLEPIDIVAHFGEKPKDRGRRRPRPLGDAERPRPAGPPAAVPRARLIRYDARVILGIPALPVARTAI